MQKKQKEAVKVQLEELINEEMKKYDKIALLVKELDDEKRYFKIKYQELSDEHHYIEARQYFDLKEDTDKLIKFLQNNIINNIFMSSLLNKIVFIFLDNVNNNRDKNDFIDLFKYTKEYRGDGGCYPLKVGFYIGEYNKEYNIFYYEDLNHSTGLANNRYVMRIRKILGEEWDGSKYKNVYDYTKKEEEKDLLLKWNTPNEELLNSEVFNSLTDLKNYFIKIKNIDKSYDDKINILKTEKEADIKKNDVLGLYSILHK